VMDKDLYRAFIIFKAAALTAALTVNVVSDYISLLVVERWLIKCASRPIFAVTTAGLIALALVLAGNFLRALITLFITGAVLGFNEVTGTSFSFLNFAFSGEAASYTIPATLVFAWLPLFALGMISIRFLNIGSWLVGKTQWYLKDGNDHPLKAVGYVAGVFVFVLAVCWQTMVPR
jgi:hypothetical protein